MQLTAQEDRHTLIRGCKKMLSYRITCYKNFIAKIHICELICGCVMSHAGSSDELYSFYN